MIATIRVRKTKLKTYNFNIVVLTDIHQLKYAHKLNETNIASNKTNIHQLLYLTIRYFPNRRGKFFLKKLIKGTNARTTNTANR